MKWGLAIVAALISCLFIYIAPLLRGTNNVCKTFPDYYSDRDKNENCYYNPDHTLEVPDIIKRHGYPIEIHSATTKDGYILTLFRIPHGRKSKSKPVKPVFVQHGLSTNPGTFVNIGRKSLAFVLSDAGYDVWLGSFRGTKYALNHTHLNNEESKYWDFSFHEHGVYDIQAQIDYVYQMTKQKIVYIGFSMGATSEYVYSSIHSDAAVEKLKVTVSLVPSPFLRDLSHAKYITYIWPYLKGPIQALRNGKIYPKPVMPMTLYKYLCFPLPIQMEICQLPDMFGFGFNYEQNDPETLPITMQYNSDASSVKTISHYVQKADSGNFQQFDYGEEENQKRYGSPKPPSYDLSKVMVPHYILYAPNDKAATKENIKLLFEALPEEAKVHGVHAIKHDNFAHFDPVTGKDAKTLVYDPIVSFLDSLK